MARIRSIKLDLFMDDGLAEVSIPARFLLAGLPCLADRAGRLEDRPRRIQAQIFPYDPAVDVGACLAELARSGHIIRYAVDGERYVQVCNWDQDQRPHVKEAESSIPPPLDSSKHRSGTEAKVSSPGTRRELAGTNPLGSGVLDPGSGDLPPSAGASAVPGQGDLLPGVLPTPPTKPAKKAKEAKKPEAQGDPRHTPLISALTAEGWPFDGGKDAAQVKGLLALADQQEATRGDKAQAEVLRRARIAWGQFPDFHSARTLTQLRMKWGEFEVPLAAGGKTRQQEIWEGLQERRKEALEATGRTYTPEMATADYINTALARWKDTKKADGSEALISLGASFGHYCEDPRYLEKGLPVKLFLSPGVFAECEAKDKATVHYIADLRAPGIR